MYRYNRKDGKIVLVDEFTRNYVSCSDVSRGRKNLILNLEYLIIIIRIMHTLTKLIL